MDLSTPASYYNYIELGLLISCTINVMPTKFYFNNDNAFVRCAYGSCNFQMKKYIVECNAFHHFWQ